mmetsp:Transcript_44938/g.101069  ORF Transcript_44938/g.101069 Transcript_44938/m.101069 type:complete len:325 (-) Transcript_44938:152-1126(-)
MAKGVAGALSSNDGLGYLAIIALQYGVQPMLAKSCISADTPTSSLVLGQEVAKIVGCVTVLCNSGNAKKALRGWTLRGALLSAGLPSVTYLIQNYCIQIAYQNLDGVAFNVLNQSKSIFTAIFSFLIAGRRQSRVQCLALGLVTLAGVLVSLPKVQSTKGEEDNTTIGFVCVLLAAALSGVGSGITEWAMQREKRDNYLLSAEIAILGCIIIAVNLLCGLTSESEIWWTEGLFHRWGPLTLVPVLTQGMAGIVVGIITKVAGGVRKILATICGLTLTCVLQHAQQGGWPSPSVCVALPLVAFGIYLHASYPPVVSSSQPSTRHD